MPPLLKVISGGQTGADRTALEVARELGLPTGGTAPRGWQTDEGPAPDLADFGLVECAFLGYRIRTRQNVYDAAATVLFGNLSSPGCTLTRRCCQELSKPVIENPSPEELYRWLLREHPGVVNVAGNRRRTNPGIVMQVRTVLTPALTAYREVLLRPSPVESTPAEELQETAEAIERIERNTSEAWTQLALDCVYAVARQQATLTTEDVWVYLQAQTESVPVHDNRAMGPIMQAARRAGWIERRHGLTKDAERMSHGRPLRVWDSRVTSV